MPKIFLCMMTALLLSAVNPAWATDPEPAKEQSQVEAQEQEMIYGSQLMTPQERGDYRALMRAAKSPEERQTIQQQHHEQMQERARAQGLTLPDEPPAQGMRKGMGSGDGMSGGMGPGRSY